VSVGTNLREQGEQGEKREKKEKRENRENRTVVIGSSEGGCVRCVYASRRM